MTQEQFDQLQAQMASIEERMAAVEQIARASADEVTTATASIQQATDAAASLRGDLRGNVEALAAGLKAAAAAAVHDDAAVDDALAQACALTGHTNRVEDHAERYGEGADGRRAKAKHAAGLAFTLLASQA